MFRPYHLSDSLCLAYYVRCLLEKTSLYPSPASFQKLLSKHIIYYSVKTRENHEMSSSVKDHSAAVFKIVCYIRLVAEHSLVRHHYVGYDDSQSTNITVIKTGIMAFQPNNRFPPENVFYL